MKQGTKFAAGARALALLIVALLAARAAAAQPTRGITPEDYYQLQTVTEPSLSSDGKLVAYVVTRIDRKQNRRLSDIWVAATDGTGAPWPMTTSQSSRSPQWSPDGRRLAFISARPAPNAAPAAPAPKSQVYVVTVAQGGDARQVTNLEEGVDAFVWSPDGTRLALVSKVATAAAQKPAAADASDLKRYTHSAYKFDGVGYTDHRHPHLFVADLTTGVARQVTSGDERDDETPSWSPDSTRLVFAAARTQDEGEFAQDVWTVPAAGGSPAKVSDVMFRIASPRWSPDGTRIAYVGAEDFHTPKLRVAPATGGASIVVASELTFPTDITWAGDSRSIYASSDVKGEGHLFRIELSSQKVTAVTTGARMIGRPQVNTAANRVAYLCAEPTHPADVYVSDVSGRDERRITHVNEEMLQKLQLASIERIPYKGADGWDIDGFFMKPIGWQEGKSYPMILSIHGGPNGMYGMGWTQDFQAMAAHGYAVFFTNPRGSSGYGARFQRAVAGEWGGKAYVDIMNGVDAILARYSWIDRGRLAVTGQSYGGFMTDWIVGHTTRFGAAISLSGISDFISVEGTRDGFYGHAADFGGDLFEHFEDYWKGSPLKYASQVKTPTLILHGDADQRVPLLQGEEWFRALRHFGVPAELVIFPREPHSLRREPRHQVQVIELTLEWCDRYLNPRQSSAPR